MSVKCLVLLFGPRVLNTCAFLRNRKSR